MPAFADIAIPTVPRDALTYSVPEGLADAIAPGQRVMAPLGRRIVMGFVVRVHDERPGVAARPLHDLLELQPSIIPRVMELGSWMSTYYVSPLGDALKACLPQGMDVESERFVSLATADEAVMAAAVGKSKTKRQIVDLLRSGEVMAERNLLAETGLKSLSSQLRDLMMDGVITVESTVGRQQARRKTVNAVRLLPPWNRDDRVRELFEMLEKRAPRQVDLLAVLWTAQSQGRPTVPVAELLPQAHATMAQVRALEEKEIVEVLEEEVTRTYVPGYAERPKPVTLTDDQRSVLSEVVAAVDAGVFRSFLLHGVTASGKTQVYIEAIRHVLSTGRTALVLVPEIALTPQLVARFQHAFRNDVAVMHSRMSVGERYDAWRFARDGRCRIVVGVRSAVFAPLANPGLIIVDEEHETSYKQSDAQPRYHARDAAVMRGFIEGATVLLGSATPSAESWANAAAGKYRLLEMPRRIDDAAMPDIVAVDMTAARAAGEITGAFSRVLGDAIRDRAARRESCIILHNRRGYAPHLECTECGYVEQCDNCSISLVYHKDRNQLRCHYCGAARRAPAVCPRCGGTSLDLLGAGTQRVEEDLAAIVPEARVVRMDLDTTRRKGSHDQILTAFGEGEADVLLGTQMVAKGLDFERVTLVGVISAEQSLLLPDFRAAERTFQILTQVSGRSGRGKKRGLVIIQSQRPDHPVLLRVYAHDYRGFIEEEIESRRAFAYPPFSRLVLLAFSGPHEDRVAAAAEAWHRQLVRRAGFFAVHPPMPALLRKINNRYRWHMLARVDKRSDSDGARLRDALRAAEEACLRDRALTGVRVDIDVDPQNMM